MKNIEDCWSRWGRHVKVRLWCHAWIVSCDLQKPYNEVYYEITGNSAAMECFAINKMTGVLVLKQSLLLQPCQAQKYTIKIRAYDGGDPPRKSSEADVTITVGRNRQPPIFQRLPYTTNIPENLDTGHAIYTVSATDQDREVRLISALIKMERFWLCLRVYGC